MPVQIYDQRSPSVHVKYVKDEHERRDKNIAPGMTQAASPAACIGGCQAISCRVVNVAV
jgi:hypothetical protein